MLVVNQPFGEEQLEVQEPRADRPLEGGGGDAEHAEQQGHGIGGFGFVIRVEDFGKW